MTADMIPTDTEVHLSARHGFTDWSLSDYRDQYPEFKQGEGFDFAQLHGRDHRVNQWDLDHEHDSEGGVVPPA